MATHEGLSTHSVTAQSPVHAIPHAWLSTGGTGAQNYDEFSSDTEVTAAIQAQPDSVLALEMPHRAPASVQARHSFGEALPLAVKRLHQLQADGRFAEASDVVAPYRIDTPEGPAFGVFCHVDTTQISSSAEEPGVVIRNEDVFAEKVRERVALTDELHTLLSAVLLLQTQQGEQLQSFLSELTQRLGDPSTVDVDQHGQRHSVWLLGEGADREQLLQLAGGGELVVADGNHRTLAAQTAGLRRFLAVITTPQSVRIRPYHRLVRELGAHTSETLLEVLVAAGASVERVEDRPRIPQQAWGNRPLPGRADLPGAFAAGCGQCGGATRSQCGRAGAIRTCTSARRGRQAHYFRRRRLSTRMACRTGGPGACPAGGFDRAGKRRGLHRRQP